jgi:integrase
MQWLNCLHLACGTFGDDLSNHLKPNTWHNYGTVETEMATIRNRNGRWHVQIRKAKARTQSRTFAYRKDAEYWAREAERQIDLEGCGRTRRELLNDCFSDLLTRYESEEAQHKKSYHVEVHYLASLRREPFSGLPLAHLRTGDIQHWIDAQSATHKPSSVIRRLGLISRVFNVAIKRWDYPMENPVSHVRKPAVRPLKVQRIGQDVLAQLQSPQNRFDWLIIFALETGMRRGEILSLTWQDIDKDKRLAYLRDTKNGHPRFVPLTDRAIEAISHSDTCNECVFPMTGNAVQLAWKRLKKRHGIEGVRFHDLRHEAISRFFDMGLTVPEVASISGHRTVSMLFRYAHADIDVLKNKLNL